MNAASVSSIVCAALALGACSVGWGGHRESAGRDPALARYVEAHYEALGSRLVRPVGREEFRFRLQRAQLLFLGDHHRDRDLHQRLLELLERICASGRRPLLGLEAVGLEDHVDLQEYLAGGIPLDTLRRRMRYRWPDSWLDNPDVDREFFRDLLRLARRWELPVFPLESTPRAASLSRRDAMMAGHIVRAQALYPDRLTIVLVGHAHLLGEGHLVQRVPGGVDALCIAARMSARLAEQAGPRSSPRQGITPPPDGFYCSDRGILFFPRARHDPTGGGPSLGQQDRPALDRHQSPPLRR